MLPHLDTVIVLLVIAAMFWGVLAWFGVIFQNVLFQRYRMNKNEAAMRKERLYNQRQEKQRYSNGLLGEIKGDTEQ